MMWKARTLRLSPTSQVTGTPPGSWSCPCGPGRPGMMGKARTLRLSPTSQVTGSTPVIVENGVHQPGFPLVHGPERLGGVTEGEDVSTQLGQRQLGEELSGLPAGAGPAPRAATP